MVGLVFLPSFVLTFAGLAAAKPIPLPQGIDMAAVLAASPAPTPSVVIDDVSQIITIDPAPLISQAAVEGSMLALATTTSLYTTGTYAVSGATTTPDITYDTSGYGGDYNAKDDTLDSGASLSSSDSSPSVTTAIAKRSACLSLPLGFGPAPTVDSPGAFLAQATVAVIAIAAPVPSGYVQTFSNLQASSNALGYLGYTRMTTYDTVSCANMCNKMYGCAAINVYFERDPSVSPGIGCTNPASTTNIMCTFWGGPVDNTNTFNVGQWRSQFWVAMAGSNGYVNQTIDPQAGYDLPTYLGNSALNAPTDCNGANTYLGNIYWTDGKPFDAARCAAACTAYSSASGDATSQCRFFNTYILSLNKVPQGQYCAMYNETWDSTYATYRGYTDATTGNVYTIQHSYSFSNTLNPGVCTKPTSASISSSTSITCPASNGLNYTASNNDVFQVQCYTDHSGGDLASGSVTWATSMSTCLANCVAASGCIAVSWVAGTGSQPCYLKNFLTTASSNTNTWAARYVYKISNAVINSNLAVSTVSVQASVLPTVSLSSYSVANASFISTSNLVLSTSATLALTSPISSAIATANISRLTAAPFTTPTLILTLSTTAPPTSTMLNSSSSTLPSSTLTTSTAILGNVVSNVLAVSTSASSTITPAPSSSASATFSSTSPTSTTPASSTSASTPFTSSSSMLPTSTSSTLSTSATSQDTSASNSTTSTAAGVAVKKIGTTSSTTRVSSSVSSTTTSSSSSTSTTMLTPVTTCANLGAQFAYYTPTAQQEATGDLPETFWSTTPAYTGSTTTIGGSNLTGASAPWNLYGAYTPSVQTHFTINHRGYFFADQTATYTFSVTSYNEIAFVWLGDHAYSGYASSNADICTFNCPSTVTTTFTANLVAGSYTPLRVFYSQLTGSATLAFQVTAPNGMITASSTAGLGNTMVQYSCDGYTGPHFVDFGSETPATWTPNLTDGAFANGLSNWTVSGVAGANDATASKSSGLTLKALTTTPITLSQTSHNLISNLPWNLTIPTLTLKNNAFLVSATCTLSVYTEKETLASTTISLLPLAGTSGSWRPSGVFGYDAVGFYFQVACGGGLLGLGAPDVGVNVGGLGLVTETPSH